MATRHVAALLGAGFALALVVGCGGGAGVAPEAEIQGETVQTLRIDFVNNTVTVIETPVDGAAKVDTHPSGGSPDMELTLTVLAEETGNPGYRHVDATITNNGSSAIGVNAEGVETGVDLCVTSVVFYKSDMSTVEGGGMGGYHSYNALTQLPVYRIDGTVAVGATSDPVALAFQLPKNVTTAEIGIEVRADSALAYWPAPSDRYVTTVAGHPNDPGFENGPLAMARFYGPVGICVREDQGDVLVAEETNDAIRKIDGDTVSTFAVDTPDSPIGIAQCPDGRIAVASYTEHAVYLLSSSGGTSAMIAGTGAFGDVTGAGDVAQFDNPTYVAASGDDIYVTDNDNMKLKRIRYNGSGSRYTASNYTVSTLHTAATEVAGVAVDHLGNVFFGNWDGYQVLVLPAGSGTASVVAGTGAYGNSDGRGDLATFDKVTDLATDEAGTVHVAEYNGAIRRIRRIDTDITQATSWKVETLLDDGTVSDGGDAGVADGALGIDVADDGTIWITDGHSVRRIDKIVN